MKTNSGFSGPFPSAQLKVFADTGKLPRTALVAKSTEGPWIVAEKVSGLFQSTSKEEQEEEAIRPSDLVPDSVKNSAAIVGNAVTGLSKTIVSSLRSASSSLSTKVESASSTIAKFCDDGQDPSIVQRMIERVREICTSDEEILYVAVQSKPIANFSPDCVVISNKRFIIFRPKLLGQVTFYDCLWKDSKNVHMKENIFGAEIAFESKEGQTQTIDYIPKTQARQIYRIGQEMEEESIALRRKLELESLQAGADRTVINQMITPNHQSMPGGDDQIVLRMAKLKSLFENGLISGEEYQKKRNEILDSI
ncbi:MAG: PH domain-containing protein [Planctomycetes bacterium]|nr:PH domain-containing protein [Planctomycetota bacterium]